LSDSPEKSTGGGQPIGSSGLLAQLQELPSLFGWHNVREFHFHHIVIRLHEAARTNTVITANGLRPRSARHVLLEGNVSIRAVKEQRELQTDRVVWWLDIGLLAVPGPYQLRNNTELSQGRRTVFDLALQSTAHSTKETYHEASSNMQIVMQAH
jgi:hypothetical protein